MSQPLDITAALLARPGTRREGGELRFQCIYPERHSHGDAHPSASWNEERKAWNCKACGAKGGWKALAEALGLEMTGIAPPRCPAAPRPRAKPTVTRYPICTPDGRLAAVHVCRDGPTGKALSWQRPDGQPGLGGVPVADLPLYGSERLCELPDGADVVVAEGEKSGQALLDHGHAAVGTVTGAAGTPSLEALRPVVRLSPVLWPDNDDAGRAHMARIAARLQEMGCPARLVDWPEAPPGGDAADAVAQGANLSALLQGARPVTLPEAENLATLLEDVGAFIRRYVVAGDAGFTAITLWVAHTWAFEAAECTPYLHVTSPEKQSGKTRLLEVLNVLAGRPWFTSRVSAAVLVRKVARDAPTLLLDETDSAFKGEVEYAAALRGILNSGYRCGGAASLCVKAGKDYELVDLPTFCPKALAVLLRYHLERTWTPPDELIEKFVREQAMVEVSFARARPRERWRRLRFVIERARAFTQVKGNSLRSFLDWIERQAEEGARLVETPAPETDEDAVRIMTIHAAKGLEFPVVVLAGLGSAANFRSNTLLLDRKREKVEVRIGAREAGFSTGGYEEAKDREKKAEQAEDVRLMYVAATRARDHLVVSLFRAERATSSHAASISQMAAATPDLWNQIALTGASASKAPGAVPTDVGVIDTGEDRKRWQEDRSALIERASKPASLAVTALAGTEKDEAEGGEVPYRRGRGGASLGRAVHAVLQSVDFATGEGLEAIARAQAKAEAIRDRWAEIVELTSRALSSAVVKRAVNSGRYYREVFVSTPLNGTLLEGFIDLVFEEDGALVIADYKTDSLGEDVALEQARERYAIQVGAYAFAVQQVTSIPVREVVLGFLRPAREVSFTNIAELTDKARKLAEAKIEGSITG